MTAGGTLALSSPGVSLAERASITVPGAINGFSGSAIVTTSGVPARAVTIRNLGTLSASSATLQIEARETILMLNSGTILSDLDAVDLRISDAAQSSEPLFDNSSPVPGLNDGLGLAAREVNARIFNRGTISGTGLSGVALDASAEAEATGSITILKSGTISGGGQSVVASFTALDPVNGGLLPGDARLSRRDDIYRGALAEIEGVVCAGAGNDTAIGGLQDDVLVGDLGNDLVQGGAGDDLRDGADTDDPLTGGLGDDSLNAGIGEAGCLGGGVASLRFTTATRPGETQVPGDGDGNRTAEMRFSRAGRAG